MDLPNGFVGLYWYIDGRVMAYRKPTKYAPLDRKASIIAIDWDSDIDPVVLFRGLARRIARRYGDNSLLKKHCFQYPRGYVYYDIVLKKYFITCPTYLASDEQFLESVKQAFELGDNSVTQLGYEELNEV